MRRYHRPVRSSGLASPLTVRGIPLEDLIRVYDVERGVVDGRATVVRQPTPVRSVRYLSSDVDSDRVRYVSLDGSGSRMRYVSPSPEVGRVRYLSDCFEGPRGARVPYVSGGVYGDEVQFVDAEVLPEAQLRGGAAWGRVRYGGTAEGEGPPVVDALPPGRVRYLSNEGTPPPDPAQAPVYVFDAGVPGFADGGPAVHLYDPSPAPHDAATQLADFSGAAPGAAPAWAPGAADLAGRDVQLWHLPNGPAVSSREAMEQPSAPPDGSEPRFASTPPPDGVPPAEDRWGPPLGAFAPGVPPGVRVSPAPTIDQASQTALSTAEPASVEQVGRPAAPARVRSAGRAPPGVGVRRPSPTPALGSAPLLHRPPAAPGHATHPPSLPPRARARSRSPRAGQSPAAGRPLSARMLELSSPRNQRSLSLPPGGRGEPEWPSRRKFVGRAWLPTGRAMNTQPAGAVRRFGPECRSYNILCSTEPLDM